MVQPNRSITYSGVGTDNKMYTVAYDVVGVPGVSAFSRGRVDIPVDLDARQGANF